jgi:hypothetical protein
VRNPPRIMHQAESANPKNTRNFYRVFDESGYITEYCTISQIDTTSSRGAWPRRKRKNPLKPKESQPKTPSGFPPGAPAIW